MGRSWLAIAPVAVALAASGAHHRPHLAISGAAPVHVRGTGFHSRERVRVVLRERAGATLVKRVTATRAGAIDAPFGEPSGPCVRFSVTATGSLGSLATLTGMKFPDCIVR
jgi:hypothetical protein